MTLKPDKVSESEKKPIGETKTDEWRRHKQDTGNDYLLEQAEILMKRSEGDIQLRDLAYTKVIEMVYEYPNEYQRDQYLQALGAKFKPLKYWKAEYKRQKELHVDDKKSDSYPDFDADTTPLENYGFYEKNNSYYFATSSVYTKGTNFKIEPLFHIYSMTNNRRLIRITNDKGITVLCDVPSDAMVSVDKFQNFLYNEGTFLLFITNQLFKKLLLFLGDENFPKCFEIKTFGWQPEGFYAFADGAYNGTWQPVDKMGIIEHEGKNYFSPAFSEVYSELRTDDDIYENDRRFVYRTSNVSLKQWSELIQKVYAFNNNGTYGIAYLCAALFRSLIYNTYKIFPHLFLHGEKGSGKSNLGWSLSNVFQHGTPPFNLSSGTDVAFFRWLARYRDVIIWYDEYSDSIDEKRFQALKSAFDGVGREKGKLSRDSRTESDKINSAALISGQHLPQRDDNSLYTRSIVRFFAKPKDGFTFSEEYDYLKKLEDAGLSQIITTLLDHRQTVERTFARTFSDIFEDYKVKLSESNKQLDDRILRNYTILAAIVWVFQTETPVDLCINHESFRDMCLADAIDQNDKINSSDALGTFWKIFAGLIQDGQITESDYNIVKKDSVSITRKVKGSKVNESKEFNPPTRVLYVDFDRVYQKYMEYHKKIYSGTGIGLQTMIDYSHNHWSYIGLCANHYFSHGKGKNTSAHMFNYDMLVDNEVLPELINASDTENKAIF